MKSSLEKFHSETMKSNSNYVIIDFLDSSKPYILWYTFGYKTMEELDIKFKQSYRNYS